MEAVGAGANVLAFVVLGLKSVQVVYETLSAIRDGPEIVQQLAKDVQQLHSILTWVTKSRAAARDLALLLQAQQYTQELEDFANSIQNLRLSQDDRLSGRCWKRLKAFTKERDLVRLSTQVNQHASLLNTRITALSSEATFETKASNDGLVQTARGLESSVQTQFNLQTTRFLQLGDAISSTLTGQEQVQRGFKSLEESLQTQESLRINEVNSIQASLREIRDHIFASSTRGGENSKRDGPTDECQQPALSTADKQILDSLDRLGCLANEKAKVIDAYSEEDDFAMTIIDHLQQLLRSIQMQESPVQRRHFEPYCGSDSSVMSFESALRRLGSGSVNSTFAVNEGVSRQMTYEPGIRIQQTRTLDQKDVDAGKLNLVVSKRKRLAADDTEDNPGRRRTDYSISLTFLPGNAQKRRMVVASLSQHQMEFQGITSISTLMVNRVLPAGSRVFEVVKAGGLKELERMFREGEASPRDHDEFGASLLMYATQQPDVCKFLISLGLDVDHVASARGARCWYGGNHLVCPLQVELNDVEIDDDLLRRINQCRRLLLEAGADPTLSLSPVHYAPSYLSNISSMGTAESIRLAWNSEWIEHVTDINAVNTWGRPPLLIHCSTFIYSVHSLNAFISAGADVLGRDEIKRTCLHICLSMLVFELCLQDPGDKDTFLREFYAIKFLLDNGADPFATDNDGRSVAQVAYTTKGQHHGDRRFGIGSYGGDLWDSVVQSCGYDISKFRTAQHRRRAKYTQCYSRQKFEWLWSGRESQCPYWDDEPWPPRDPGETDSEDDETDEVDSEYDTDSDSSDNETEEGVISEPGSEAMDDGVKSDDQVPSSWDTENPSSLEEMAENESDDGRDEENDGLGQSAVSQSVGWDRGVIDNGQESDVQGILPWQLVEMEIDNPWLDQF
ncbi:hypothetical protein ACJZ2D_014761 [Fusarium nematophilum]